MKTISLLSLLLLLALSTRAQVVKLYNLETVSVINLPTATTTGQGLINVDGERHFTPYGFANTFLGRYAGRNESAFTGDNNVGIGQAAGLLMTTAARNVIVGSGAGQTLSTGVNNVFIGAQAGSKSNWNTGYNNVLVGNYAGLNVTSTAAQPANVMLFGHDAGFGETIQNNTAYFSNPSNPIKLKGYGDFVIGSAAAGLVLKDNNNVCWRITVNTSGALITTSTTCP